MPWDDHYVYFAEATGLMPHHIQMNNQMRIEKKIDKLPERFEEILDERQMAGPVSLAQMQKLVDNSPVVKRLEQNVCKMSAMIESRYGNEAAAESSQRRVGSNSRAFPHPDGTLRGIPVGWDFPTGTLQSTYVYWHCGDPAQKILPMKFMDKRELSVLAKTNKRAKRTHTELLRLMGMIDKAAKDIQVPPKEVMTQAEAHHCYTYGKEGIVVPSKTPKGRPRDIDVMTWQSVLRLIPKRS